MKRGQTYLPSSSWMLAAGMPLIALGGILFLFYLFHGADELAVPESSIAAIEKSFAATVFSEEDIDSDNLKDWEESLWGSDAYKADTDADGTPDGAETDTGRDPTIAGPNDYLEKPQSRLGTLGTSTSVREEDLADSIAQNIFMGYVTLKKSGNLTPENMEKLVDQTVAQSASRTSLAPRHKVSEFIVLTAPNTLSQITTYKEALGIELAKLSRIKENEFIILLRFGQEKRPEDKEMLEQASVLYNEVATALLMMPVPEQILNAHASVTNGLFFFAALTQKMQNFSSDPINILFGIKEYENIDASVQSASSEIVSYVSTQLKSFSQ